MQAVGDNSLGAGLTWGSQPREEGCAGGQRGYGTLCGRRDPGRDPGQDTDLNAQTGWQVEKGVRG